MSILVKGMKMPETCMRCDFLRFYNAYCCGRLVKKIDNGKRREDCPLAEVPPHGRLIDADALIKYLRNVCFHVHGNYDLEGLTSYILVDAIKTAPTVVESEV